MRRCPTPSPLPACHPSSNRARMARFACYPHRAIAMNKPQPVDRKTFLAHIRRSGLVAESELTRWLSRLPDTDRGRVLARALVAEGVLTRFQAERLLIGRTAGFLLGQYRILDQIGRGGMGRVFKAEHLTMRRLVALKVLAPHLIKTGRAHELFFREVRATSQLVHPNIVTAFDASAAGDRHYLVLEYVDGPNLDQLVAKRGPLPVAQACEYVRQVAHGLQCAHNLGMVHRDVKPANLLVQRRGLDGNSSALGLVKISDFGLARLHDPDAELDEHDRAGTLFARENTVLGTPDFLSPEQARCLHQTDIRSDLYSLGCTFYFLLTGQVPFPGGSTIDKLIRHNTEPAPALSTYRSDVPPVVTAIVDKLLAKKPAERFQTPAELADALQPFAVTGPIPWAPPPPPSSAYLDILATPIDGATEPPGSQGDSATDATDDDWAVLGNSAARDDGATLCGRRRPPILRRAMALLHRVFKR